MYTHHIQVYIQNDAYTHIHSWQKATKYIYTSTAVKYNCEVLLLKYLDFSIPYNCPPFVDQKILKH